MIRAAVITFPGSNCDDDLIYALGEVCGFQVKQLWHKDTPDLSEFQVIGIPGGFSYGDYLRCGAMAAHSPIMARVKAFANNGGYVFGLCNGFQILCEAGLLPGALVRNESLKFVCKDVNLAVVEKNTPWTNSIDTPSIRIPIAHGDGRYVIGDSEYKTMQQNGQILFKYEGENPNGSMHAIAGVCNDKKNVFAMMPHPERASDLRSFEGIKVFQSIRKELEAKQ